MKSEPWTSLTASDFFNSETKSLLRPTSASLLDVKKEILVSSDGELGPDLSAVMKSGSLPSATEGTPSLTPSSMCSEPDTTHGSPLLNRRPDLSGNVVEDEDEEEMYHLLPLPFSGNLTGYSYDIPPAPIWESEDDWCVRYLAMTPGQKEIDKMMRILIPRGYIRVRYFLSLLLHYMLVLI